VTSVGRELLKLFQNSPFSLDQHNANLQELMMSAALRSKFSNSKPNITKLNVSMNEDKSCTVESCVKFINTDDCTVAAHAFSVTSSTDTRLLITTPTEDMLIMPHIKRRYINTSRYLSLTSEEFVAFLLNSERQALKIAQAVQEQVSGKVYRLDLVGLYIQHLVDCHKDGSTTGESCSSRRT